ncbi:MAG: hypothetical protein J6S61_00765, partial [Elusimicrobiaceae bacterium]|nr:hypothetical protein [Elusimicrobiaceae bacterium]
IMPILDMLAKGEELYYLNKGQGTTDARELDIQLPGSCVPTTDDNDAGTTWSCGKDFRIGLASDGSYVWAVYCPDHNTSKNDCDTSKFFQLGWGTSFHDDVADAGRYAPNSRRCWMPNNANPIGEEICKLLGKPVTCGTKTCYEIE